jgi:hypothetical protein|tara:strand:+ start:58 stop:300 length:243 start_codon:yes stop_codon:yes gene_type:complete
MSATVREFRAQGFTIVPQLLSVDTAAQFSAQVLHHLAVRGERYNTMLEGNKRGGWYVADFPSVPALAHMLHTIMWQPRSR